MYEHKTYAYLMSQALSRAPTGIDTRQGSIFRDSISAQMLILAGFYVDLDNLSSLVMIDTAPDEYLDARAKERAVERQDATLACYALTIEGTIPEEGTRFFSEDGLYFTLLFGENDIPYVECETPGTAGNGMVPGTLISPVDTVQGLVSATVGELIEAASDIETDDSLRERFREALAGPAENGNKQHYKTWCESVLGVGFARIIPLWNGPNTVKGIIFDDNAAPAGSAVIARVQEYVDPDFDGDGEGDGLGEGAANLGSKFTAVAPTAFPINVSVSVVLAPGTDAATAKARITDGVTAYLNSLIMESDEEEQPIIRYTKIGSILHDVEGVIDYTDLLVNDDTVNIQPAYDAVGVVGTITVSTTA